MRLFGLLLQRKPAARSGFQRVSLRPEIC